MGNKNSRIKRKVPGFTDRFTFLFPPYGHLPQGMPGKPLKVKAQLAKGKSAAHDS